MEAVVLAGGFGTRLKGVVSDVPKPMAPIAGRPFLEILLGSLAKKGFTRVVLSVGYLADMIVNHFGPSFEGMSIAYAVEEFPKGTGGGLRQALSICTEDHVFVFNGDTYLDVDIFLLEALWSEFQTPVIVARQVADCSRFGELSVLEDLVVGLAEKNVTGPGLINAGCYVFPLRLLNHFPAELKFSLETDFLSQAVKETAFRVHVTPGHFIDIGVPEDYSRAQTELAGV
jgi:D-glycero-alpha-D-manno-heptose 1-phosphate guanylyltransferase